MITDARQALHRVSQLRPDVILIDVDLGDENGFELAAQLHRQACSTRPAALVMMSAREAHDFTDVLEVSPALGFIAKSALSGAALRALLNVHRGAA